ncbi:hypothetical protein Patl1_09904 [Pistacia atlantica]|uniref:Uncharacterized protein n=1 Tax=Pistacia atlantica TaxID=434234 RepID=A0ACC1A1H3_9ROSI|nr:hypothetical protein Patl1_09904 [Pistacia atlantica]
MATPYQLALNEEWEQLKRSCNEQGDFALKFPRTPAKDTIFHLAVFSKSEEPLKSLLDFATNDPKTKYAYLEKNIYGNTALHEAAADGNIKAVELLVKHHEDRNKEDETRQLLEVRNNEGETPLFKAAAYGQTKKDAEKPEASILHAAIQGENFETALKLLKLDKSLATLEDEKGMTSLQLLATMPSAFRSGYRMTILIRLLYSCPLTDDGDFCCIKVRRIGLPILRRILEDKRKHKLAFKLTQTLIDRDTMWQKIVEEGPSEEGEGEGSKAGNSQVTSTGEGEGSRPIALFLATERGIVEIVNEILEETPQLAEYIDDKNRNMLHIAIMHRQREIFDLLKEMNIPMKRLVRGIDIDGYTILHHAADMTNDKADIQRGPAYHLQEELKCVWRS